MIWISEVVNQIWKAMNERYGVTTRFELGNRTLWSERIRKPIGDIQEKKQHQGKGLSKVIRISDSTYMHPVWDQP